MNYILTSYNLINKSNKIYNIINKFKTKHNNTYMDLTTRKERSDMILEPLQVMTQLALLSHSPIGTKVSVSDNILQLHPPSFFQYEDGDGTIVMEKTIYIICFTPSDDIINGIKPKIIKFFTYILESAIRGIEKLIVTYSQAEQTSITHTLALYKNVLSLESPDLFKDAGEDAINIDTVFQNIKDTYDRKLLKIIFNTLLILDDDTTTEDIKPNYIDGLLNILKPTNIILRKWIREKLTC